MKKYQKKKLKKWDTLHVKDVINNKIIFPYDNSVREFFVT